MSSSLDKFSDKICAQRKANGPLKPVWLEWGNAVSAVKCFMGYL
jgi:hypothetical protein